MALLVHNINSVAKLLVEVLSLPRDTPLIVLTGFTRFSVLKFVGPFVFMLNTESFIQLDNYGDRHDNSKCLKMLKNITLLGINSFHSLNVSNQWNIPSNHWHVMSKKKVPCDNCDGKNYSPDLPHPCLVPPWCMLH